MIEILVSMFISLIIYGVIAAVIAAYGKLKYEDMKGFFAGILTYGIINLLGLLIWNYNVFELIVIFASTIPIIITHRITKENYVKALVLILSNCMVIIPLYVGSSSYGIFEHLIGQTFGMLATWYILRRISRNNFKKVQSKIESSESKTVIVKSERFTILSILPVCSTLILFLLVRLVKSFDLRMMIDIVHLLSLLVILILMIIEHKNAGKWRYMGYVVWLIFFLLNVLLLFLSMIVTD